MLVWSESASDSLAKIYFYIMLDSPQNAVMVIDKIIELAETLQDSRFQYAIDPIINKEKFRHITIWSYKIIYETTLENVIILDIFDGRQNPEKLKKY